MKSFNNFLNEKKGLWDNIHAKRKRGEKPNPPGHPDRPTNQDFKNAQKTSKKEAVDEKTLTPAEKKKREEIAKAMERDNPGMPMAKKMAIATATAKKVAEGYRVEAELDEDWKKDSGWRKPEVKKDKFGNIIKTKNVAKSLAKASAKKSAEMAKESVELDEGIEKMSHSRLKWHMNTGVPHGSYTKDEMKKERDRRLKTGEGEAYKKAKPSLSEVTDKERLSARKIQKDAQTARHGIERKPGESMIAYLTRAEKHKKKMQKEAKEDDMPASKDEASMALKQLEFIEYAAEEMMDHIKSGKAFPEWFQNKLSKAHGEIEGLHSAMGEHGGDDDEEDMKESTELDEAQLDKMKKISPGFDDRKKAERHNDHLVSKKKASNQSYVAKIGNKYHVVDMKEAYGPGHIGAIQRMLDKERKTKKYTKPTQAEIDADRKKDQKGKPRPSITAKSATDKQYGGMRARLRNEAVHSADKKPEKFVKPDGKIGIRMVPVDKKVVDKDA